MATLTTERLVLRSYGRTVLADHGSRVAYRSVIRCRQTCGEQMANNVPCYEMDEGRKRVLLIAAAILAARKLSGFDGGKRVPATVAAISDAVRWAEEIMREIDRHWPVPK